MSTHKKISVVFLVCFLWLCLSSGSAYCIETPNGKPVVEKWISGQVVETSWVGSSIVIRWLQPFGTPSYDEFTFVVPKSAAITKGTSTIGFTGIRVSNNVNVRYYIDSIGTAKVISIDVLI